MNRKITFAMAVTMLAASSMVMAAEEHGAAAPAPEGNAAATAPAAPGGGEQPAPGSAVTGDRLPGFRVQKDVDEELAHRAIPDADTWKRNQHLSFHMDLHMGSSPERYHHLTDPEHTRYYKQTAAARADYEGELARARELAEKEIAIEEANGKAARFIEEGGSFHQHHAFIKDAASGKHTHRHGQLWSNGWERTHRGCIWWIRGDIEKVGSRDVLACEGHNVPEPRPVRWNDALHSCPLPQDAFFRPPPEHTVVVPFPLPREGDWRAHISPGMNRIVDQTDWLRVVSEGHPECPKEEPVSRPEGD